MRDDNPNEWIWTPRGRRRHDLSRWQPVKLPTSVQEALWRAGRIPNPYRDLNSRAAEWVEHRDWVFGLDFDLDPPDGDRRTFLHFESVADECIVFLNGEIAGRHEGPGAPFEIEIGGLLRRGGNQLLVVVRSPHQEDPQTGWTEQTRSLRGRMGFGWDFAPRLVPIGILGDVSLRQTGAHRLRDLWARPSLSGDLSAATIDLSVEVDGPPGVEVRFTVLQSNRLVATATSPAAARGVARARVELPNLRLWWPNGLGDQPLYTARAEVAGGSDRTEATFGVRDLRWEARPGSSAGAEYPLTLVVNGRRVFQRGWNWVPADAMGGPRSLAPMRRLLRMAREAHANVLRCWGGADPESAAFYKECDRLGILVWQEFPLSSAGISNTPPSDPEYLGRLQRYARDVVAHRRNHPSLALWGGGNELTGEDGRPLTLEHPYARCLAAVIAECDPDRTFRPSSPLGPVFEADPTRGDLWDVHGPWEYGATYDATAPGPQYARFNAIAPALHSETGAPGEASLETQRRFLSRAQRPRSAENPARRHHGGAWWEHQSTVRQLFGEVEDDELAVLAGQWLQAEALRYYVEESRRRWHRGALSTAGIYPWQLNEPWPNVVCTSAVEYSGRPKLAYYAVRNAYRPTIATARYAGLRIEPGEPPRAGIWALNDQEAREADLVVVLRDLRGQELASPTRCRVELPANSSARLFGVEIPLSSGFEGLVVLELSLAGQVNSYVFSNRAEEILRDMLQFPQLMRAMFNPDA
jgi:beta-mannosidase